jgi:hypothetical protein
MFPLVVAVMPQIDLDLGRVHPQPADPLVNRDRVRKRRERAVDPDLGLFNATLRHDLVK